ncbi:hypothetical protein AN958_04731 [Leucoagaricus sp. SymC.cos]|nr:hypothetical protein AN958_04731 [Leucoagaricus sp. SymC.cos]
MGKVVIMGYHQDGVMMEAAGNCYCCTDFMSIGALHTVLLSYLIYAILISTKHCTILVT